MQRIRAMTSSSLTFLERAGQRVLGDPAFLAFWLSQYQHTARIDEQGLCGTLGCGPEGLLRLRLCLAPTGTARNFIEQVEKIAEYTGCQVDALVRIIRLVDSVTALKREADDSRTLLKAARQRYKEPKSGAEE
jgi:hypothetical protein